MGGERGAEHRKLEIRNAVLFGVVHDDGPYQRVMETGHGRKNVVLNLLVEPTDEPDHEGVRLEVGGRQQLVERPVQLQFVLLGIELLAIGDVRHFKDQHHAEAEQKPVTEVEGGSPCPALEDQIGHQDKQHDVAGARR